MVDPQSSKSQTAASARLAHVLADPRAEAIADTYADAFLDAAKASKVTDALEELDSFVADVLQKNPEFDSLLSSGMVSRDEKLGVIDRVLGPRASPLLTNFLRVLARHERLDLLPLILKVAKVKDEHRQGRQRVQVWSARPLSELALQEIQRQLAATLPFQPIIEPRTDRAILGGLVIRVGDTVYDSSLRSRLKDLRNRVRERSLHEIQSGRNRFSHPEGD